MCWEWYRPYTRVYDLAISPDYAIQTNLFHDPNKDTLTTIVKHHNPTLTRHAERPRYSNK